MGQRSRHLAHLLALALAVIGCGFSAPAVACLCSCSIFSVGDFAGIEVKPAAEYHQIFSGLVISTERMDEPVVPAVASNEQSAEAPGYWIRSRILVLRIWQGAPSTVAEVWTPVVSSCDSPPRTGSYFVALTRSETGRNVARHSPCDCAQKAAITQAAGDFTVTGIALIVAAVSAASRVLFSLVNVVRRRRPSV